MKKNDEYYTNLLKISEFMFSTGMDKTKDEMLLWIRKEFNYSKTESEEILLDILNIMDKCLDDIDNDN